MQHRFRGFWGQRAMFGIRIPIRYFPVQPPEFPKLLAGWRHWDNDSNFLYDYENDKYRIGFDIFSIIDKNNSERDYGNAIVLQSEKRYEACNYVLAKKILLKDNELRYSLLHKESLEFTTEETEWCYKLYKFYNYRENFFELQGLLGEILLEPYDQGAKTYYFDFDDKFFNIIYSVKWFYPNRKRRFCSSMARTLRQLNKMKIEYRY